MNGLSSKQWSHIDTIVMRNIDHIKKMTVNEAVEYVVSQCISTRIRREHAREMLRLRGITDDTASTLSR